MEPTSNLGKVFFNIPIYVIKLAVKSGTPVLSTYVGI